MTFCGRLLMGVAACISLYLACNALGQTTLPGCESGSDCSKALRSPWAFVFGLPVSFPGFVLYSLALLLSGPFVRRERSRAGLEAYAVLAAVVAGAIWFSLLQIVALQSACLWCSLTQGAATAGAVCLCAARLRHPAPTSGDQAAGGADKRRARAHLIMSRLAAATSAMICTGMLATGAWSNAMQRAETGESTLSLPSFPAGPKGLPLYGGKIHINPTDFPVIGSESPDARTVFLLSDYTSDLSRQYHSTLESSLLASKEPLRIVVLPAAQTPEAVDIQRAVLAAYHVDQNAWKTLSALITSGQIPAKREAVARAARKLMGAEKWTGSFQENEERIGQQIRLAAAILKESRQDSLPVLVHGAKTLLPTEPDINQVLTFAGCKIPAKPASADTAALAASSSKKLPAVAPKPLVRPAKFTARKVAVAIGAAPVPVPVTLAEAPSGNPEMTLQQKEWELKSVEKGKSQEIQIEVRNTGAAPLTIGWLGLDAGCEVTSLPIKAIPSGEAAKIGVRVTPPDEGGEFSLTIQIHSNAPGEPGTVTVRGILPHPADAPSPESSSPSAPPVENPESGTPPASTPPVPESNIPSPTANGGEPDTSPPAAVPAPPSDPGVPSTE
jgi:uncharacterized membrane protein